MRVNVDKVLERDQKLSELDDRADALQAGASQFETSAAKLKNKYWWKNAKVGTCTRSHHELQMYFLDVLEVYEKSKLSFLVQAQNFPDGMTNFPFPTFVM